MPLRMRAKSKWESLDVPVSLRINEKRLRMRDAANVFSNQGRVETCFGYSRYNSTSLGAKAKSLSYFKDPSGTRYLLAKVELSTPGIYLVTDSGLGTKLQDNLTSGTRHRAVTMMNGRHIVAVESDGLFSYDGTTFTQLGQNPPSAPTVAASGSGNSLSASSYQVACTFYASSIGFETNIGTASSNVAVSSGEQIDVTDIPSTANNDLIDKVRVYFKDVTNNGSFIFWSEINLGTTTETIDDDPSSSQTPPTANAKHVSGGAKYLAVYNRKLVTAGNNTNKNSVYFSEEDLPDAFDDTEDGLELVCPGDGPITGVAVGFYNQNELQQYLVVFKENSTHVYSEIGGTAKFTPIDNQIGCVSHDTIKVINGDVYFMSQTGWRVISNGLMIREKDKGPISLGNGDINDIFKTSGYAFELNRSQYSNFFSVYHPTFEQYITFVAEGSSTSFVKTWNYEFNIGGFRPYLFPIQFITAATGKDANNNDVVYMADDQGFVYTHSDQEERTFVDADNNNVNVAARAQLIWQTNDDMATMRRFRKFYVRALSNSNNVTVKAWINYNIQDEQEYAYSFPSPNSGFVLDVSRLDQGILSDGREIVTGKADINRIGESLLIGFYQEAENSNMGLLEAQLDHRQNSRRH